MRFDEVRNPIRSYKDREAARRTSNALIRDAAQTEQASAEGESLYAIYDAPLIRHRGHLDSDAFENDFGSLAPREMGFKNYIEELLGRYQGNAIGIEFGGPASRLFADFTPGFFKKSVGITLTEQRTDEQKAADAQRNHTQLFGDFQSPEVKAQLAEWLDGEKAHFIVQRMGQGNEFVPRDPYHLAEELDQQYGLLARPGLMFQQTPRVVHPLLDRWIDEVHDQAGESLLVRRANPGRALIWEAFELRKGDDAPEHLPVLSARQVSEGYNDARKAYLQEVDQQQSQSGLHLGSENPSQASPQAPETGQEDLDQGTPTTVYKRRRRR